MIGNISDNSSTVYKDITFGINIIMLVICCFGIYGNIISMIIFTKRLMRSSINIFLTALSIVDSVLLLTCVPTYIVQGFMSYFAVYNRIYNAIVMLCLYPLSLITQTCSVWTFVLITVERYFAVCQPFYASKSVTVGRAKKAQAVVVTAAIIYNLVRFREYRFATENLYNDGELYEGSLRDNSLYFSIYFTTMYFVTHLFIPLLTILILNIFIIRSIRRSVLQRFTLTTCQGAQHSTSRMVIIVTIVFILCNFLTFALSVWEWCDPDLFEPYNVWCNIAFILIDVSNICVMLNSSLTFIIYIVYCKHYHKYFRRMQCCVQSFIPYNSDEEAACRRISSATRLSVKKLNGETAFIQGSNRLRLGVPHQRRSAIFSQL